MDPFSALIVSCVATWLFSKYVAQDALWAIRGQDPPSYRREQARRARRDKARAGKAKASSGRRPARGFVANAWGDAWDTAEERRRQRREERRRRRLEQQELLEEIEKAHGEAHKRNAEYDQQWERERRGRHRRDDAASDPSPGDGDRRQAGASHGPVPEPAAGRPEPATQPSAQSGRRSPAEDPSVDLGGFDTAPASEPATARPPGPPPDEIGRPTRAGYVPGGWKDEWGVAREMRQRHAEEAAQERAYREASARLDHAQADGVPAHELDMDDLTTVVKYQDGLDDRQARAKAVAAVTISKMQTNGSLVQQEDGTWTTRKPDTQNDGDPQPAQGEEPATTPGGTAGPSEETTTGGPVESQGYEADKQSFADAEQKLGNAAQGMEDQIAGMLAGGMGNDPETMSRLAGAQESMQNAQAQFGAAQQSMGKHEAGREYADSGHAADTGYLKTS